MTRDLIPARWGRVFRRREGALVALYALGVLGVVAAGWAPVRERIFFRAQLLVRAGSERWIARVEAAEALLAVGRVDEGVRALESLDRRFPAPTVRGALDQERERLMGALAQGYEAQGREGAALRTWERRAMYDPRNYTNHVAVGDAYRRLKGTWTVPIEARDAYLRALAINPAHLPSLREVLQYDFDRGDFAEVITRWEGALHALLLLRLPIHIGDSTHFLAIPIDGVTHEVVIPLGAAPSPITVSVETSGLPGEWESITAEGPHLAGVVALRESISIPGPGSLTPGDSVVVTAVPTSQSGAITTLRLRLRMVRPVDRATWTMVTTSYRNLLNPAGLAASAERVRVVADQALADRLEVPWP